MPEMLTLLTNNQFAGTMIIIVLAVGVRLGVQGYLSRRGDIASDQKRRILSGVRNALFFVLLVALAMIWAPSLRTFALSLTAFAVAIILATKELILCISGSFVKTASAAMRIGSWVEINGIRGEVVDQTIMTTTLQELGKHQDSYEFTGRTIVLPNSIFLTAPVINERFHKRYVYHSFQIVTDSSVDFEPIKTAMIAAVKDAMEPEKEVAGRYQELIENRSGISIHGPEPRTRIESLNDGKVKLVVTAFLPTKRAIEIEQKAMFTGMAALRSEIAKQKD